jgi:hypothetical protein
MKKREIRENLVQFIQKEQYIQISRSKIDDEPIQCIPMVLGGKLLFIRYYYDFLFDGYKLLRVKDLTDVRYNQVDQFAENILRKEGLVGDLNKPLINNLDNWFEAFKEIERLNQNIIIECEDSNEFGFYIGRVKEVNNTSISFQSFNALGKWENSLSTIYFKEITLVSVGKRYTKLFSKYLSESRDMV